MKKIASLLLASAMMVSLVACSGGTKESVSDNSGTAVETKQVNGETMKDVAQSGKGEKVEISFLVTKPEIVPQFEETFQRFMESHPNVTISAIPLYGQTIYEKLTSLYASGNAPIITMVGGPEFTSYTIILLKYIRLFDILILAKANALYFTTCSLLTPATQVIMRINISLKRR